MVDEQLLSILACLKCKGPVVYVANDPKIAGEWLDCAQCRLRYEVKDSIPVMLIDEAKPY